MGNHKKQRDFTLASYGRLLQSIKKAGYSVQTVEDFYVAPLPKAVILRHDVDSWPLNALYMAQVETGAGLRATYYFRTSPLSYNPSIIRQIVKLGHEIGYHYEDLSSQQGDYSQAMDAFQKHLKLFRRFYHVRTIAMHGKPLSRWNNLDLWKSTNFREFGLIAEPYLSLDFDQVLYLTDTGNCWDGNKYSIRDNVSSKFRFNIHTTSDLTEQLNQGHLPQQIMLNVHPARWNDNLLKWMSRYYILTLPKYQLKKWVKLWRNK